jgi:uncharacterized protein (TIGR01777 family)
MEIAITGSGGLIGSAVASSLEAAGHRVTRMVRSRSIAGQGVAYWNPDTGELDLPALEGKDAVIHFAGENISQRWTSRAKARIRDSRVKATRFLAEQIGRVQRPPKLLLSASAIGYYGERGDEVLTEASPPGLGFLSDVCGEWEAAAGTAGQWASRIVLLRIGIVLSSAGGALAKMLPPFRLGVGGKLGSGRQYMSWVTLDDAVGAISYVLATSSIRGPVNVVAPAPVTNLDFTKALGRALSRPTLFPVPRLAVSLGFGEMGRELLLASSRVQPARLASSGFTFRHPEIEQALRHVLGK